MYEFFGETLTAVALPRTRDFRGLIAQILRWHGETIILELCRSRSFSLKLTMIEFSQFAEWTSPSPLHAKTDDEAYELIEVVWLST